MLNKQYIIIIAMFIGSIGLYLIVHAYSNFKIFKIQKKKEKKINFTDILGIIFLLLAGILFIYYYSFQPIPKRLKEYYEKDYDIETLPDISDVKKPNHNKLHK